MGFHDMVSASEAASLSGVSVATLQRFAQVGYLNVDSDSDGVPLFSKRELQSVFGLALYDRQHSNQQHSDQQHSNQQHSDLAHSDRTPSNGSASTEEKSSPTTPSFSEPTASSFSQSSPRISSLFELLGRTRTEKTAAVPSPANVSTTNPSEELRTVEPSLSKSENASPLTKETPPRIAEPSQEASHDNTSTPESSQASTSNSTKSPSSIDIPSTTPASPTPLQVVPQTFASEQVLEQLSAENRKLRHVLDLQERILSMREDEIRDLKQQRDWLQKRLERLEEKSDRDQLLLLSETQTIRKLISFQTPKKSALRLALEWFGMGSDTTDAGDPRSHGTIEVHPEPRHARSRNSTHSNEHAPHHVSSNEENGRASQRSPQSGESQNNPKAAA